MGACPPDASVEERLKYAYELHPADLVHFPQSQTLDNTLYAPALHRKICVQPRIGEGLLSQCSSHLVELKKKLIY